MAGGPAGAADALVARFLPLHPKRIDLSLGRIERLLAGLGHPERRLPPVIHVAGTNGKGSTVAFMRAVLEAAGRRVHVYTSPHLVRFHERIRLAGRLVSDEVLAEAFARCEAVNAGQGISVFEITTAAALLLFAEHTADALLLEVGLGGRYDATNVVPRPLATVITPVSMDHREFLGATVAAIAGEKAGILKRGVPAVVAEQCDEARAVIEREAARVGAPAVFAGQDFSAGEERGRLVYQDGQGLLDLPLPRLAGRHQHGNAAAAVAALRAAFPDLPASAYEAGLSRAEWPARLQPLKRGPLPALLPAGSELWLDGGHNAAGGRILAEALAEMEERQARPLLLVCGMLATKDPDAFLAPFAGLAQEIIAVPIAGEGEGGGGAHDPDRLLAAAAAAGIAGARCPDVPSALRFLAARKWPVAPRVLVAGSLHLAGEVLGLNGTPPE
nr:folylpolyglutamate synthase/dihydrofolate synthase family protein [Lichenibacterium sp. 6Y81]